MKRGPSANRPYRNVLTVETKKYTPEERLMLSNISENIKDYLKGVISGDREGRMFYHAKNWIFSKNRESDHHVFGFCFTCRYFGIDPERMREKIREIDTPEKAKRILSVSKVGPYVKRRDDESDL